MNKTKPTRKILLVLLPLLLAAPLWAQDQGAPDQGGNPPNQAARLSVADGNVSLQPSGETDWSPATRNYTLTTGDRLYTDQGARAELEAGPYAVRMSETTDLTLANFNDQILQLGVGQGSVQVSVYELPSGQAVEIDTPNGALTVQGPGSYRVDVDPNNGTRVIVNSGSLQITAGDVNQELGSGQAVQLTGTNPVQVSGTGFPGQDGFDQWCQSRDARVHGFRDAQYVSPYVPGAEDLQQYGVWQEAPDYGPVWYPSGVAADWVPYRFGHWAWIEPWGWTWVEDEPWGFAPFHYGRWAMVGSRWGWVPGPVAVRPIFAPALVAFVGGGGFSVGFSAGGFGLAAWFPLGPRDPFIPWYHASPAYIRQVNVTNVRNVTNITNITNVNVTNIHYAYRNVATTAVPGNVFRSGQSVAHSAVRVTPQQLARAQVIAHPDITPARTAAFGGRTPAPRPVGKAQPIRSARVVVPPAAARAAQPGAPPAGRGSQPATRVAPNGPPAHPAPNMSRAPVESAPPARGAGAPANRPAPGNRPAPQLRSAPAERAAPAPRYTPPSTPPRFVTRTPPPARDVPFTAHQPALRRDPGRPLEPQQEENLRQGRPAGPPRDREILPHATAPKPQPRSEARPAPNENKKH
jgi:hypothetical protein